LGVPGFQHTKEKLEQQYSFSAFAGFTSRETRKMRLWQFKGLFTLLDRIDACKAGTLIYPFLGRQYGKMSIAEIIHTGFFRSVRL
jgi:hypothetical protein